MALSLLVATVALADEGYTLPGTACDGNSGYLVHEDGYSSLHTIEIETGEDNIWGTVYCPMLRRQPDTSSVYSIFAKVDDGNNADDVSCVAWSCIAAGFGTTCTFGNIVSSSGRGISQLPLGTLTGFNGGSAWVACEMPDHDADYSKIKTYNWND